MKTLPGILVALFDSLEKERREVQEDGVPFKRYFGPVPLRLAMAFARETALDEATHVARGRLAGDEAARFAARMVEKKRQPLFPGAPTSVTEEAAPPETEPTSTKAGRSRDGEAAPAAPRAADLFYAISPATHGVVFARPERARYVSSLHKAMNAKTWGKFKSRLPAEEWEWIADELEDGDGCPGDDEPFDSSRVPGFCDGDWPPWLQKEMGEVLPASVLGKYAKKVASCINGYYWEIEERDLPAILKELEALGIRAERAPKLTFH